MFKILDRKGNFDTQEQIDLIKLYIAWFGKECVDCILVYTGFVSERWLEFLN